MGGLPKSKGRIKEKPGRLRGMEDDSEAEGYGWSRNKYSWDTVDAASDGSVSAQSASPVLHRKSNDVAERDLTSDPDNEPVNRATRAGDNAVATQKTLTASTDRVGELHGSEARVAGQQHSIPRRKASPNATKSGKSATDGDSSQPSHGQDARPQPENVGRPAGVTVGKPIRGARWGEAIGVRSKIFDTATIPTSRADLKIFVSCPLRSGPGTVLRCFIERNRSGTHKFSNVFSMYADLEDGSGRLLLAARKVHIQNLS